jgi:PEP-CTERM motif
MRTFVCASALILVGLVLAPASLRADSITSQQALTDITVVTVEVGLDHLITNPTVDADLLAAASAFGAGNYSAEVADLDALTGTLGLSAPPYQAATVAPEPSSVFLLVLGAIGLLAVASRKLRTNHT